MSAKIKVVGIGGAGNNAINRMKGIVHGVEFIAVNTDQQDLQESVAETKLAIGSKTTKGLGSGGDPSVGQRAAEESKDEIREALKDADLVFITAGMGGGTGTGAAPIVAMVARELEILTVGVVTKPFGFEGKHRARNAEIGISNLSKFVDCNIVVPNQKLVENTKGGTTMLEAFAVADDVLRQGVQCITDLIVKNMTINIDFADIANVIRQSGIAHMGIGEASGDNRLLKAIQMAIQSPILETTIKGASQIILSVTGGEELSVHEVDNYGTLIKQVLDDNANIKFGVDLLPEYNGKIRIIIIATGFPHDEKFQNAYGSAHEIQGQPKQQAETQKIIEKALNIDPAADQRRRENANLPPYIEAMRKAMHDKK
jgi:cell division protein FtsZ